MTEKDPRGAPVPSQRPRSPRVPVEFALEVEGKDPRRVKPLAFRRKHIKISRSGATIVLDVDVAVGPHYQTVAL